MHSKPAFLTATLSCALAASTACPAQAQSPVQPRVPGALLAVETLKNQVPEASFDRLVEISGKGGTPIPKAWTVITHDLRAPGGLTHFVVRGRKVESLGEVNTFYPRVPPEGFFKTSRVGVDSEGAFSIADKQAGLARVGFDNLDFRLRTREFSDDAVWTVRLRNADDEVVGNVDIAAGSGKVLRTVWYYRDPVSGTTRVVDSAWSGFPAPAETRATSPSLSAPAPNGPLPPLPPGTYVPAVPGAPLQPAPAPELVPVPEPGSEADLVPAPVPGIRPVPAAPVPEPLPAPPLEKPADGVTRY